MTKETTGAPVGDWAADPAGLAEPDVPDVLATSAAPAEPVEAAEAGEPAEPAEPAEPDGPAEPSSPSTADYTVAFSPRQVAVGLAIVAGLVAIAIRRRRRHRGPVGD
jgi:hypothetical protein